MHQHRQMKTDLLPEKNPENILPGVRKMFGKYF